MRGPWTVLRAMTQAERLKAALLSVWFFFMIATLSLMKPLRTASLLAHLGAIELPYVRFGAVLAVGVVVAIYSRVVNRFTRLQVAMGSSFLFAALLIVFWLSLAMGGAALGAQRWFVWAVFILVDIYSTVMIAIFWTYTNDVVTREEADALYGPIGLGGILGGIAGGATVDALVAAIGPIAMLLVCAIIVAGCGGLAWLTEAKLKPPPRALDDGAERASPFEGARLVFHSRYLLLIVGIVVAYEFAAAISDFVVNVVFERAFHGETELARMTGRLGWIISATALVAQIVLVPILLPHKRIALLLPPIAMAAASIGLLALPAVGMAMALATSDRGLNYSLQQVTKETLYVPLTDAERYKAKAFIDMLTDRAAKALSSLALMAIIAAAGTSITASLVVVLVALAIWMLCANALGPAYDRVTRGEQEEPEGVVRPTVTPPAR